MYTDVYGIYYITRYCIIFMMVFILFSYYPNPPSRNIAPSRAQHQRRRLKFPQRLQPRRCRRRRGLGLHGGLGGLGGLDGLGLGRLVVLVGLASSSTTPTMALTTTTTSTRIRALKR
jgi:hypothetical protein